MTDKTKNTVNVLTAEQARQLAEKARQNSFIRVCEENYNIIMQEISRAAQDGETICAVPLQEPENDYIRLFNRLNKRLKYNGYSSEMKTVKIDGNIINFIKISWN